MLRIIKRFKKEEKSYPNRFVKFYQLHKRKINSVRRSSYSRRKKAGICVRCQEKALRGIVFCRYHKLKQRGYNQKARKK